jgi:hypothetical protein
VTVHYPFLAVALVLLFLPRTWLRFGPRVGGTISRRATDVAKALRDSEEPGLKVGIEAAKGRNWVDFGRAVAGGCALTFAAFGLPEPGERTHWTVLAAQGVLLGCAVIVQMVRVDGKVAFFAPIFFLQGLTFGVGGWLMGLLAMFGTWGLAPVIPGAGMLLFVHGLFVLVLGYLMRNMEATMLFILVGLVWLPVLTSLLAKKRLSVAFDRRQKSSRSRRSSTGGEEATEEPAAKA